LHDLYPADRFLGLAQKESAALADDSARAALSVYCIEDPVNIIAAYRLLMYRIAAIFIVEDAALTGDMSRHAAMLPIRADKISPHFFFSYLLPSKCCLFLFRHTREHMALM